LRPEECKINQICERATILEDGKLTWNFDALGHVVLAKEYGLKCKAHWSSLLRPKKTIVQLKLNKWHRLQNE
jgi:hypothetical protein